MLLGPLFGGISLVCVQAEADATKKAFNPFKMVPGNSFEVRCQPVDAAFG